MSRYFNQVVLVSDSDFDILVFPWKAILATQFDAFVKGKLFASNQSRYGPITKNLRTHRRLPITVVVGSRSF